MSVVCAYHLPYMHTATCCVTRFARRFLLRARAFLVKCAYLGNFVPSGAPLRHPTFWDSGSNAVYVAVAGFTVYPWSEPRSHQVVSQSDF